jgi:hypothetical protein
MRFLILLLSVVMTWTAAVPPAVAEPASVVLKTREGSLVLGGGEQHGRSPARKDTLHTMLSREVQVYVFRGNNRISPQPYVYGQSRFYPPAPSWQRPAGPYLETLIQKYASRYGVDPSLVRAVMRHESGFNPNAVSPKGAQGLMQLMPGTAASMGVNDPFNPEQNIAGGVGYLRHCLDCFNQNVPLAVAAYNAGPGRVSRSQGVPAIPETQAFVKNVMGAYTARPAPATAPPAQVKPSDSPKPKMATRPAVDKRILPVPARNAAADADTEEVPYRPRAKVIVVHYPSAKQYVVAKPAGAD